jgi:hypothetical protein
MPYYLVCSEEYGEVIPVTDYGEGPMEYSCDVWEGFAANVAAARKAAYQLWKANPREWKSIENNRGDGRHPMSGAKVEWLCRCSGPLHGDTCGIPKDDRAELNEEIQRNAEEETA